MKIVITGASGLFGYALAEVFRRGHTIFALTHADLEITDAKGVHALFAQLRPDVVVHAAAIPDPDRCETDPARANSVNVEGTRHVAEAAREMNARLAFISSDAVFDGRKRTPYTETDPTNPPTVYGRTKVAGEQIVRGLEQHWIFRVSVLFGPGKTNFVEKCLRQVARGEECTVASDQVACATYTMDAADKIREVVEAQRYGLFHVANTGACSRLELARRAASLARLNTCRVIGRTIAEMGRPAKRLEYSVMEMEALWREGFSPLRPWDEALQEYVRSLAFESAD